MRVSGAKHADPTHWSASEARPAGRSAGFGSAAVEEADDGGRALGGMGEREAVEGVGEHLKGGVRQRALEIGHDLDRNERTRVRVQQQDRTGDPGELGGEVCQSCALRTLASGESRLMVGRLPGHLRGAVGPAEDAAVVGEERVARQGRAPGASHHLPDRSFDARLMPIPENFSLLSSTLSAITLPSGTASATDSRR